MANTPSQQGQQHQLEEGKDAIAARDTTILQQWQRCLDCKDACTSTTRTPLQWGQWPQLNNSKDACALMMAMTLLLQGQWCQLNDYTSLTAAEMPSQQGQQLPSQWQQRRLHINDNNAIVTRATTPSWWWQENLSIDDDKDAIATRVTTPAWGWRQQHCKEGNNAIADQEQQRHSYKGNNASLISKDACALTTATMPSSWGQQLQSQQWQRCLHINGNGAITTRATTPAWQWAMRVTMLAQQWRRRLHIDNGKKTIVRRTMIAIATLAKTLAHQWQQCNHNKGNNASFLTSNEGNNVSSTIVEMPAHQQWQWCHHNDGEDDCVKKKLTLVSIAQPYS
jgi:hypothetical protein